MAQMHDQEILVPIDAASVMIARQFPEFSDLPLKIVESGGTDHTIYRLGHDMAMRLPRINAAARQAEKDFRWLKPLAAQLSLKVPTPIAIGHPTSDYPYHWEICEWLDGDNAFSSPPANLNHAAVVLARFVLSLRAAPVPGDAPNDGRGGPLALRDDNTRAALRQLDGLVDVAAIEKIWRDSLDLPQWAGAPVWIHGDIHPGNLITRNGEVTGIIDFGCLTTGDPATDLMIAWSMLDAPARRLFRMEVAVDEATWLRGRAWALSVALIALPYYLHTNPLLVSISQRVIREVLADSGRT